MFEQVKIILSKVNAFHSLCTAGKWLGNKSSATHFNVVCWNFEKEGCSVNKCPQTKDQKKIITNRETFRADAD